MEPCSAGLGPCIDRLTCGPRPVGQVGGDLEFHAVGYFQAPSAELPPIYNAEVSLEATLQCYRSGFMSNTWKPYHFVLRYGGRRVRRPILSPRAYWASVSARARARARAHWARRAGLALQGEHGLHVC